MSWPHGSTEIDERSQNNNMFASKSALQSNKGGSQGDRFPLYVTNIPVDMDEDQLKEKFSKAGNVIHAKCLPPKEGRNSKVGFVTFPTEKEAELAISTLNKKRIDHQTITVDYTKSFKEQRAQNAGKSDSPFSSGNKGPSLFSGNNNAANPGAMSSFGARKSPQQSNLNGPSGIGRGIHYDNEAESQPGSIVNGQTQRLFNVAPGTPAQGQVGKQDSSSSSNHTMCGQSDNQNNLEATRSDSTYENFSPAAEIPTQPTDQISYQSNVNTMANGFSSMYLTQSADQVQMSDGQNEQQSNQNQYGYSQSYDANEQQSNQHQYGYSQSYDANQAYNENQTYVANDQNQAYDPNQTDEQNPAYGHSQSQDPNQAYDPSQAYGENAAYTQNQSQAYEESQVYDPNAAYYQSQSYEKNQSYDPNQAFTQNQTYGETPTYEQNQAYSENQSYNQNQTYDQTQQYDQAYAQEQGYGQNQWYGQNQSYDGNQAYDQNAAYDPSQAYGHNQAYSQETYDKDQIYDQKQSNDHQPIYDQKQADDQNKTHDQNHAYDPSNESPASAQYETPKQNRSFDQMFAGMSKAGDGQQQSFGQNQFQVSSRLPKSNNDSGGKTCHNCGQPGHFSRECPTKKSPGGACHRCGESGHFARECPSSGGSSGGGGTCHNCGQPGHFSRECPSKSSGGGSCHKRGEQGHFARECPQSDQGTCPRPEARVDYVPPPLPEDVDTLFKSAVHKGINFDRFDNIPVEVTGNKPPAAIQTFDELLLPDTLKSNIARAEFTKPTPVQKYGMPIILTGRDIMACAQTGSGKTIAFLLPVMAGMVNNRLAEASYLGGDAPCPAALCVAPTRELAYQIFTEALKFSTGTYLRPVVCYGGVSVSHQLGKLERGCHILIGTPGRLIDFAGRNKVSFSNVRYLILDEADRMLEMGFEYDIRKIITQFGMPEKTQRQTLMFSATFPDEIQKLAGEYLNDYLFLAVGSVGGTNLDIKQEVLDVQGTQKRSVLMEILGQSGGDKTLVFVERKRNADFLASWLSQNQCAATSISGDRSQQERESALRDFRAGVAPVLIATSVAARGLDIPDVKHVINYDLPQQIEEYVHRIGRTGRIGNQGRASAFFERGKDDKLARSLVKVLADALQDVPNWLEEVAERALGTNYGPAGGKFASRDTRQFERRNAGGGPPSTGNVSRQTTNVSLVNTSLGRQQNEDEEEWE